MNIKQNYKKILGISLIINVIIFSLSMVFVLSQQSGTFTISSGIYPSAPDYTIWRESLTYYAKNSFGQIDYSSTNASYVMQNSIDNGDSLYLASDTFVLSTMVNLDENQFIYGDGIKTVLTSSLNITILNATGQIGNRIWNIRLDNFKILGISKTNADMVGIQIFSVSKLLMTRLYFEKCYVGLKVSNTWKPLITNCFWDNNARGIVTADLVMPDKTELRLESSQLRGSEDIGIYLYRDAGGVTLNNVEIGTAEYGIKIEQLDWGHFSNVLIDTCEWGLYIETGVGRTVKGIQASNLWTGTINNSGVYIDGTTGVSKDFYFSNVQLRGGNKNFYAEDTENITITGGTVQNAVSHGINLNNVNNVIITSVEVTLNGGWGIYEEGTSDYNLINSVIALSNMGGNIAQVGANTEIHDSFNGTTYIT